MSKLINERSANLYTRAVSIVIDNNLNAMPTIRFNEEEAIIEEDNSQRGLGFTGQFISESMGDPGESYEVINPLDGLPVGSTSTVADMQVLLTSFYYYLKEKVGLKDIDAGIQKAESQISFYTQEIVMIDNELLEDPTNQDLLDAKAVNTTNLNNALATKDQLEIDRAAYLLTTSNTFS